MSDQQRRDDMIIVAALAEFSYRTEPADSKLAEKAWQLAADRLIEYNLTPMEAVNELEIGS